MLELGKKTKDYHTQISDVINKTNIDKLFVLGNYSFYTYKYLKNFKKAIFYSQDKILTKYFLILLKKVIF